MSALLSMKIAFGSLLTAVTFNTCVSVPPAVMPDSDMSGVTAPSSTSMIGFGGCAVMVGGRFTSTMVRTNILVTNDVGLSATFTVMFAVPNWFAAGLKTSTADCSAVDGVAPLCVKFTVGFGINAGLSLVAVTVSVCVLRSPSEMPVTVTEFTR